MVRATYLCLCIFTQKNYAMLVKERQLKLYIYLPVAVPETLTICSEKGTFEPPLSITTHAASVSPSLTLYPRFSKPTTGKADANGMHHVQKVVSQTAAERCMGDIWLRFTHSLARHHILALRQHCCLYL